MKTYSLRKRLLKWITIPILAMTIASMAISFHHTRKEIDEVYDAQLVHSAKILLQLTKIELTPHNMLLGPENNDLRHTYERNLGIRIWRQNTLITASQNAFVFKDFRPPSGFSEANIQGHDWRFFVYKDPVDNITIEVSERKDIRFELMGKLMIALMAPTMVFLPLILLMLWFGIRRILGPVTRLSSHVDRRSSDDLSPIEGDTIPQEIEPFILALNRLLSRMEDSFRREREFTDHAAHELRTPLAAMKTQTQVLLMRAEANKELAAYEDGLENLQSSINRATHLVDQLLQLARLQNENLPRKATDLSMVVEDIIGPLEERAARKKVGITFNLPQHCIIYGHADSAAILLNNLIDNAIKYTPTSGEVHVKLTEDGLFEVADTGPGLTDNEKTRVFKRFVRVDKTGQVGSGLGLAIAQWVATAHDVKIQLSDNKPQGLIVRIQWQTITPV